MEGYQLRRILKTTLRCCLPDRSGSGRGAEKRSCGTVIRRRVGLKKRSGILWAAQQPARGNMLHAVSYFSLMLRGICW
jgi:hypothetical protein